MKKSDVKLHATYLVKVAGNLVPVKIDREHPSGGWEGTSQKSGKTIRIKSAQRLRRRLADAEQMQAMHEADQENARLAKERERSADGQTASERAMAESAPKAKKATKAKGKAKKTPGRDTGERGAKGAKQERPSLLNLAAKVLADAGEPLNCQQMVEKVLATGQWQTSGKTPSATLYSAILRETRTKGDASRFRKVERGKFEFVSQ